MHVSIERNRCKKRHTQNNVFENSKKHRHASTSWCRREVQRYTRMYDSFVFIFSPSCREITDNIKTTFANALLCILLDGKTRAYVGAELFFYPRITTYIIQRTLFIALVAPERPPISF